MDKLYRKYYLKLSHFIDKPSAENIAQELAQRGEGTLIIRRVDEVHIAFKISTLENVIVVSTGGKRSTYSDFVRKNGKDPFNLFNKDGTIDVFRQQLTFGVSNSTNNTTYVIKNV